MLVASRKSDRQHSRRHKPSHPDTKLDASTNALLKTGCALDLPKLSSAIPTRITLSLEPTPLGALTDSILNLAMAGSEVPDFELDQSQSFSENTLLAASAAIGSALRNDVGSLPVRWWGSAAAASGSSNPREGANDDYDPLDGVEQVIGSHFVIEFENPSTHAGVVNANLACSSSTLRQYESICPGFTHILYTVLEQVSCTVYPIYTPRSLWEHYIHENGSYLDAPCDAEFARTCFGEYGMCEGELDKYDISDLVTASANDLIAAYQEEVGGVLPSELLLTFGRECIGSWPIYGERPDMNRSQHRFGQSYRTLLTPCKTWNCATGAERRLRSSAASHE